MRKVLFTALVLTMATVQSWAQCAMCRGAVESSVSAGDTSMASNLNLGILYLFFAPYVLAAVIGYFWYKRSKQNGQKTKDLSGIPG